MYRPLLLGHRGVCGSDSIRENTPAAFDRCLSDGCDGFELDVRVTADGLPVICHDGRLRRRTIAQSNSIDLPELPLLDGVLKDYAAAFLDIEIKVPGSGQVVLSALNRHPPTKEYVISSFLPVVLREFDQLDPAIPLGLICDKSKQMAPWRDLPIQYLIPRHDLLTLTALEELHEYGKKVIVWTVNQPAMMRRFAGWKVDGIISDRPRVLADTFLTP